MVKERHYQLPSVPARGHGLVLLIFWTLLFIVENLSFINMRHEDWWFNLTNTTDSIEMAFFVLRYVGCLFIFVLGLKAPGIARNPGENYTNLPATDETPSADTRSTWVSAWSRTKRLAPFLWPSRNIWLQMRVILAIGLLIGGRVLNVYVPIYQKKIVDSLTGTEFRWDWIVMFVLFKFLQGGGVGSMGLLNNARSYLWIPVQQFTTREIEVELFRHLHSLSLRWHLSRKTGEVLRVMDRGTDSINNLLNFILFSIVPTIVDILVAVVFFIAAFNWWYGLIVFVTMFLYIGELIILSYVLFNIPFLFSSCHHCCDRVAYKVSASHEFGG